MAEIPAGSKLVFIDADVPTRELKSSRSNSKTEVYTIEDIAETVGGGSDYTETIVNITPTETTYSDGRPLVASGILAMGSSPIELLPAPGAGKYYDIDKIVYEYTFGTIKYTFTSYLMSTCGGGEIIFNVINPFGTSNKALAFAPNGSAVDVVEGVNTTEPSRLNQNIDLTTFSGVDPTGGDGTLRVKIYHKTITFGA